MSWEPRNNLRSESSLHRRRQSFRWFWLEAHCWWEIWRTVQDTISSTNQLRGRLRGWVSLRLSIMRRRNKSPSAAQVIFGAQKSRTKLWVAIAIHVDDLTWTSGLLDAYKSPRVLQDSARVHEVVYEDSKWSSKRLRSSTHSSTMRVFIISRSRKMRAYLWNQLILICWLIKRIDIGGRSSVPSTTTQRYLNSWEWDFLDDALEG